MLWYERYKPRLTALYKAALDTISGFPSPLNELGLAYAKKFDPVDNDGGKDYICTLLPYWMQESASLSNKQCEQLALANVYGMLYFFIQDDVMDSKVAGGEDWKTQLALGNLLQLEMFRIFHDLYPPGSLLWDYYNRYVHTWADSVVNEGRSNYFLTNPLLISGKASPVKVCVAGAWLLAAAAESSESVVDAIEVEGNARERIKRTEEAVNTALMLLQMLDDWADWRDDLEDGSYNGLLAMIQSISNSTVAGHIPAYSTDDLTIERIEAAIYVRGCMAPYADIAVSYHEQLLSNPYAPPDLVAFNVHLLESLQEIANQLAERKRKLLGGGINLLF
ncbi:hypothetical protein ACX1C1_01595 [Paenibacillus sp. strain BS8-2]